jgi:hypothetical protein
MKRAVSVSLGSPARDKRVVVTLADEPVQLERIGTGGDAHRARALFAELDGQVDALGVGGIDLCVRLGDREYPIRSAAKLVADVHQTPVIDGHNLKYVLERRLWELLGDRYAGPRRFRSAFMPFSIDRLGLAEAVAGRADEIIFGDLMFALGIPIPVRGLVSLHRWARLLLPVVSYFPLSAILPPGTHGEERKPKHARFWQQADVLVGDMHYMYTYAPENLRGKRVITNTTTPENVELLRRRGVVQVITTTPRYEGRSFGVNMMEAALTAYAGLRRPLTMAELDALIDRLALQPYVEELNPVR